MVTRIGELGTTLAVTSNPRTLRSDEIPSHIPSLGISSQRQLLVTADFVPSSLILVNVMMEVLSSLKRRFLQEPHGVTSQNTAFFRVAAVKTSNLRMENNDL
jgi:hypothetical protein